MRKKWLAFPFRQLTKLILIVLGIHITWQLVRSEDVWDSEINVLTSSADDPDAHPHWRPTDLESLLPSDT